MQGRILFGDQDVKTVDMHSLRRAMGVVPQVALLGYMLFKQSKKNGSNNS